MSGADDSAPTGGTVVGTVTISPRPRGEGWTAACNCCPWTGAAGTFGLPGLQAEAEQHPCR